MKILNANVDLSVKYIGYDQRGSRLDFGDKVYYISKSRRTCPSFFITTQCILKYDYGWSIARVSSDYLSKAEWEENEVRDFKNMEALLEHIKVQRDLV